MAEAHLYIAHRAAALFGEDELGQAADVVAIGVDVGLDVVLGAVDEADDVGVLLDGAGLAEVAELGALPSVRDSTLRLSCDRATMGICNSLASCLREREIMETSCSREPNFMPEAFMSWR